MSLLRRRCHFARVRQPDADPVIAPGRAEWLTMKADPVSTQQFSTQHAGRMPALYLGHGAPPLLDDPLWPGQLASWAGSLRRPAAILMISAHWERAPLSIAATTIVPLVYDFWGFSERFYKLSYPSPGAPALAGRVRELLSAHQPIAELPGRGLDHGALIPLMCTWPGADVPVLQISMPNLVAEDLLETGRQAPLRDEDVLIIGSGFLTHGLPFIDPSLVRRRPAGLVGGVRRLGGRMHRPQGFRRVDGLPAPGAGR